MVIVLLGASASGKSTIERRLADNYYGFEKIVSYTTRPKRHDEINGRDYFFVTNREFNEMIAEESLAEYDEYSQNRCYGTMKYQYAKKNNQVVVLTPNGLRQLKKNCPNENIFSVLVEADLGTRIKRYIDRIGADKFNFDDKNEICSRVERDYSMFLGMDKEVDLVVHSYDGADIDKICTTILDKVYELILERETER